MLTLGYFSKFPAVYKNREKSVSEVKFNDISVESKENENKIIIRANTGKYRQEIEVYGKTINLKSPVKVYCSCESFKYEFANSLFRSGSLLNPLQFVRSIISRPKKKNQYNIPSGCKHIVALARQAPKLRLKKKED